MGCLLREVAVEGLLRGEAGAVRTEGRPASEGGNTRETGEATDAIGALGLEAVGGEGVLVAAVVRGVVDMAAMAILDGCGGERGEGGSCAGRGAPVCAVSRRMGKQRLEARVLTASQTGCLAAMGVGAC